MIIIQPDWAKWRKREGRILFLILLCGVGIALPARAHLPLGKVYPAFQFPDDQVPVIDGDLSDWDLVDSSYLIKTQDLIDLVNEAEPNEDDFGLRLMLGWNKAQNKLFVAAQVRDDVHQIDRPAGEAALRIFQDDDMELFLDADHSGGQYADFVELSPEEQLRRNGSEASHFVLAGPPPDEVFLINFSAAAWYSLADGPFSAAAFALKGEVGGAALITYEWMLVPFDFIEVDSALLSRQHVLEENQIVGLNVEFNDFDRHSELLDAKWSLSGAPSAFKFSERFGDVRLMPLEDIFRPTAVREQSWGQIKAFFTP